MQICYTFVLKNGIKWNVCIDSSAAHNPSSTFNCNYFGSESSSFWHRCLHLLFRVNTIPIQGQLLSSVSNATYPETENSVPPMFKKMELILRKKLTQTEHDVAAIVISIQTDRSAAFHTPLAKTGTLPVQQSLVERSYRLCLLIALMMCKFHPFSLQCFLFANWTSRYDNFATLKVDWFESESCNIFNSFEFSKISFTIEANCLQNWNCIVHGLCEKRKKSNRKLELIWKIEVRLVCSLNAKVETAKI